MIPIDGSVRIYVATQPVDFRAGINRLMGLVTHVLGHDACAGDVFVFRNKGADKVKLVRHDGSGAVMATKWLDHGKFHWPPVRGGTLALSGAQCVALLSGLDWQKLPSQEARRPAFYG
ncbi:IS66 family insertion sequence element accessory protein TnpB [Novosphingobium pentaromativorans]|nr:IS66 family insertion sequence element accessory protein TnpB [Novosphingobium pentaromativorans]AIT78462.1 transposase [Novosphingobium pentaromativorans US6-1]AIT79126.1 transposase [Novosphingobium pentaromativorans US6-1]AIT81858.1 transposase [Novosphingobium pentaromativorans US6-1]